MADRQDAPKLPIRQLYGLALAAKVGVGVGYVLGLASAAGLWLAARAVHALLCAREPRVRVIE